MSGLQASLSCWPPSPRAALPGRPIIGQPTVGQPIANNVAVLQVQQPGLVIDEARLEEFSYAHAMSRPIKCLSFVHCGLVVFYALRSWVFLSLLPFPLIGYWGAAKFNVPLSMVRDANDMDSNIKIHTSPTNQMFHTVTCSCFMPD